MLIFRLNNMKNKKIDYASAGVDIAAADRAKEKIKVLARSTFNDSVLSEIGAFGGFFRPNLKQYEEPVFISSTDGVGTKLKIAFMTGRHNTVGEDLVNHCINDILVHGAGPLFFLDYIATGKLEPEMVAQIVEGLARGCKNAGMALVGGETAEMPDFYAPGEYDLAGFIVGIVDRNKIINGQNIKPGDIAIGLPSTGLHTNGYSLARKVIFEIGGMKPDDRIPEWGQTIGESLLATHRSYLKPVMAVLEKVGIKGMAHITGGGIPGNLNRILPEEIDAVIDKKSWERLPIFDFIKRTGSIEEDDMYPAFNMGIGFILVTAPEDADQVCDILKIIGEKPYIIGKMVKGEKKVVLKG
ncbi:Phosphoribosylformylglycinamidine cyclo-ligase [Candidatus Zixiibacteriota bacterium]|nr:Phosphoribosylformylglycinamidine cyclo-ligase [candidate division Zixibacteria bacterium]